MAECVRFACGNCGASVDAWSDGNPYYIDEAGQKRYAYHPQHDLLERCIGNDVPYLCLECGEQFNVDSRLPLTACPKCTSTAIRDKSDLAHQRCPICKRGVFTRDPRPGAIS